MNFSEVVDPTLSGLIISVIFGAVIIFYWFCQKSPPKNESEDHEEKESKVLPTKKPKPQAKLKRSTVPTFTDPLLYTSLKGHGGAVLGLHASINGKYLASCSDDRSVRLWSVKDFGHGNKCVRVNVEYDHAKLVQFSPDSRAFIAGLAIENTVRVFKLGKKDDGVTTTCVPIEGDFPKYTQADLMSIGVGSSASGGSFVMTAYRDTTIHVRNLKGDILNTINSNLGNNNFASVSPCGRFFAACGWTPDVKVWAVEFTKSGDYRDVVRAFELKGHTSSIWSFGFNNDTTRMITVSKDGTWRFYDTDIEYDKSQEPYFLNSGQFEVCGLSPAEHECLVALSPDASVAAVACLNNITVFSTATGDVECNFKEVHSEIITSLIFDIAGRYILSSGDKHIRVIHNILGYKETIRRLQLKLKKEPASSATRERLERQLHEAQKNLAKIQSSSNGK
uniref:Transducin beta-like protein 2 n=1 Tax=Phallusia mammillata TaxID=59560 RepID=A0A6F9DVF2_9ASCI|nr:transducin beta-like protein 2 [Phallusia mammillata]